MYLTFGDVSCLDVGHEYEWGLLLIKFFFQGDRQNLRHITAIN